jgi:CRP/FNR family transcriptional regulator, cyclic AMP receptor protein
VNSAEGAYGDLLSTADRATLLAAGTVRRFTGGDTLCREGESAEHVIFIESGRVKVVSVAVDGQEALLAIRGPGELLGEIAVLDDKPRSAGVHALEPVQARIIPAGRFKAFLRDRPDASAALLSMVVGRLREADRRRLEYTAYDVPTRLALLLLELTGQAATAAGADAVVLLSQRELATATGASREAVVKALGRFRSKGIITTSRRAVTIHRPDLLATFIAPDGRTAYPDAEQDNGTE